jgi:hypothetical protein
MAVRLINPLKSEPASGYVPLPTELMAQNLERDQEKFNYAEAGIRAYDDIFKSGYSSSDMEQALREEYDPKMKELSEMLYSTGNVGYVTPEIAELNKRLLADKRYTTAMEDFNYKQQIDKILQENPNHFFNNAVYDNNDQIIGWKPIQPGQSLGSHYGYTEFGSVAEDIQKHSMPYLKDSLKHYGIEYIDDPILGIVLTEKAKQDLSWENPFIKEAFSGIVGAMWNNPDQFKGARYLKAKHPQNWQEKVKQMVEAQFEQTFFTRDNNRTQVAGDRNNKKGGGDNIPEPSTTTNIIPLQLNVTPESYQGLNNALNQTKEENVVKKEETIKAAIGALSNAMNNLDVPTQEFKRQFIINTGTLLDKYSREIDESGQPIINQEEFRTFGDILEGLYSGEFMNKNLETHLDALNFTPRQRELIDSIIIDSINNIEDSSKVISENNKTLFERLDSYNQSNQQLEEIETKRKAFYTNNNNLGRIFTLPDGSINEALVEKFEIALEKAGGDISKVSFEDIISNKESLPIDLLYKNRKFNNNGVPLDIITALQNKGFTEISYDLNAKYRNASQNIRRVSLDEATLEDINKAQYEAGTLIRDVVNKKREDIYLSLKNYYANQQQELIDANTKEAEITEQGLSITTDSGSPDPNVRNLYTAANNLIQFNNKLQFNLYSKQNPSGKGESVIFNNTDKIELNNILFTPSSLKTNGVVASITVKTPKGNTTENINYNVILDMSTNKDHIRNSLRTAYAAAKSRGLEGQLPLINTNYGIFNAVQAGQYQNISTQLANFDNSSRASSIPIDIGGLQFTINSTGSADSRNFNISVGGLTSGLSPHSEMSQNLNNENDVWEFIGNVLFVKETHDIRKAQGGSNSQIPLAQGRPWTPPQ